ncbi:MAG: class I SAM-dependent methyltransferase [Halioglobus sp.]
MSDTHKSAIECPVCLANASHVLDAAPEDYEYDVDIAKEFSMRSCNDCGSQFVWPRPNVEQLKAMYPDTYYAYDQDMSPFWEVLYNNRCKGEAKRLLQLSANRPLRLFDIGAGDCRHFRAIGKYGSFTFSGVELNPDMAQDAREQGFDITAGSFEEFETAGREKSVDILNMNHVIEHVIDPYDTLVKIHTLLDNGGVFYGRTPKLPSYGLKLFGRYWGGYHFPRHLHLFSRESLELLLKNSGFSSVEIIEDLNLFPSLSLQNFLLGKLKLPLSISGGHTRIWTLLVALTTPLSFIDYFMRRGDCMIFVARK